MSNESPSCARPPRPEPLTAEELNKPPISELATIAASPKPSTARLATEVHHSDHSLEELVELAQLGSQEAKDAAVVHPAFREAALKRIGTLSRQLRKAGESVDHVVEIVKWKVVQNIDKIEDPRNVQTYISSCAFREVVTRLRSTSPMREQLDSNSSTSIALDPKAKEPSSIVADQESAAAAREIYRTWRKTADPVQLRIIDLKTVRCSTRQIVAVLEEEGVSRSEEAIRATIHRAKTDLEEEMEKHK